MAQVPSQRAQEHRRISFLAPFGLIGLNQVHENFSNCLPDDKLSMGYASLKKEPTPAQGPFATGWGLDRKPQTAGLSAFTSAA